MVDAGPVGAVPGEATGRLVEDLGDAREHRGAVDEFDVPGGQESDGHVDGGQATAMPGVADDGDGLVAHAFVAVRHVHRGPAGEQRGAESSLAAAGPVRPFGHDLGDDAPDRPDARRGRLRHITHGCSRFAGLRRCPGVRR
ncbi:hypothetical protein [Paractinoplanes globisporus]|uniref:Uncharacterized protein n=1 Tax=Paractinoplanes globisporus TaxID=113565 RepID=A0ABW6WHP9_9ACTN|nr:hypothetical protein [Actinoplanes globisporus]